MPGVVSAWSSTQTACSGSDCVAGPTLSRDTALLSLLFAAASLVPPADASGPCAYRRRAAGQGAQRRRDVRRATGDDRPRRRARHPAGGYPGAAVVVGRKGAAVWEKGFGRLGWTSDAGSVVAERTIYDLASLTKVVGTTTAVMILFDEGKLRLDDQVVKYIPEFTGGGEGAASRSACCSSIAPGFLPGRDLWRIAHTPEEARAAVISTPLFAAPGQYYEYSDLGADMLGFVVEAVSGQKLDQFLDERVFTPLGMTDTHFRPDASLRGRIAPTELTPPRGYPLRGEVHDENAYALGGVAGHAGLFSTASDLVDLRADDAQRGHLQRHAHRRRLHGASCSPAAPRARARSDGTPAAAMAAAASISARTRTATPASPARRSGSIRTARCSSSC